MIFGGVAILDFGSQYNQLIARRIREMGVYCELIPGNAPFSKVMKMQPAAIILSGGPCSVYDEDAPIPAPEVFDVDIPILGICYGMQLLAMNDGGIVKGGFEREYGPADLNIIGRCRMFEGVESGQQAWMSHGDRVVGVPDGYSVQASTDSLPIAAMASRGKCRYGVQFHPEVNHTEFGTKLLENFIFTIAGLEADWNMQTFRLRVVEQIRSELSGSGNIILGLSGGVDSSVVAALLHEAIPGRFYPIFVDNGLLRAGEREAVENTFV
ncbi:MAG: glutamine-hydrolyzing GMP synthase, partial [FCB group bacterium]|nr:glutamine-hydrolyzing GMP synthase [FCB group bacterium]